MMLTAREGDPLTTVAGRAVAALEPRRVIPLLLALLLALLPLLQPVALDRPSAGVTPYLTVLADREPGSRVQVIIKGHHDTARLAALLHEVGGEVTRGLAVIDAVAATIPAEAIPVLASSPEIDWISPDTAIVPRAKRADERLFLQSSPIDTTSDTYSSPVLPLSETDPIATTLVNLDADRDGAPGLTLRRGGSGPDEADPARVQRWALGAVPDESRIRGDVTLKIYTVAENFDPDTRAQLNGYLIDRDPSGNARVIARGELERASWGNKWKRRTLKFRDVDHTLPAGHTLELALTVDGSSRGDLWLAFGTEEQPSYLRINRQLMPTSTYLDTIGATGLHTAGIDGSGVTVALLDSGIDERNKDLKGDDGSRILAAVDAGGSTRKRDTWDESGHGTYLAGIIASNGRGSDGTYSGVAPAVDLVSVRVSDRNAAARESDVVAGLGWVLDNKDVYNIRVVNLSLNSADAIPYQQSPIAAAAEILWFNGIVVVVAGGNNGGDAPGVLYPPASDPFVIAVGASDDQGSGDPADDTLADFSAFGKTPDGYSRPDLVAPGVSVVGSLGRRSRYERDHDDNHVKSEDRKGRPKVSNFEASGTSVSAAVVSGAAALLLEAIPQLNPDQVKYLLVASARPLADPTGTGAGSIDIAAAIALAQSYPDPTLIPAANTGQSASPMLWTGNNPVNWGSVSWGSVGWGSVSWGSVGWGSVSWGSVGWGSVDLEY